MKWHVTFSNGWAVKHIESDNQESAMEKAEATMPKAWRDSGDVSAVCAEPED